MNDILYLSRRNLQTLLNKLDRNKVANTKESTCAIIKNDNKHPLYAATMARCVVVGVEDEDYYAEREAGLVHPLDEPK